MIRYLEHHTPLEKFLVALVVASLLARLHLALVYEINWDEFLNLSMVHDHARGILRETLQTIFVHGFGWVGAISVNEVDQVIAARLVIFALGVATAGFIYLVAGNFMPRGAALFAVACYLSFSLVLRQGGSFRTDPIATCLLMAALWVMVCKPREVRFALLAGGLIGLAGMITIKAIFYAPTIAIILLIHLHAAKNRKQALVMGLATGGFAILSFLAFYLLHRWTLVDPASAISFLERTTGKTLGERNFGHAIATFRGALRQNPLFWLALLTGFIACGHGLLRSRGDDRIRWATLSSLAVILGSLFVYTESFAYYYPFMLAPVTVLCGAGLSIVPSRARSRVTALAGIALVPMLLGNYVLALGKDTAAQRETLAVIHTAFPEPVPYIDRTSMVSAYPKRGFFMSVWGMTNYYRAGVAVMPTIIERDQPRFLIANRRMLELDDLGPEEYGPKHFGLFKADLEALQANYIRHWGAIYVAGKRFSRSTGGPSRTFQILIEGPYTVESTGPVILDGGRVLPGDVVTLDSGPHRLRLPDGVDEVTLRWGDDLFRPDAPAPEGRLFNGF